MSVPVKMATSLEIYVIPVVLSRPRLRTHWKWPSACPNSGWVSSGSPAGWRTIAGGEALRKPRIVWRLSGKRRA